MLGQKQPVKLGIRELWMAKMQELQCVRFNLKPGESSATTFYCTTYRERLRCAWHFFKVAASFLKPSCKSVTSNIIKGYEQGKEEENQATQA